MYCMGIQTQPQAESSPLRGAEAPLLDGTEFWNRWSVFRSCVVGARFCVPHLCFMLRRARDNVFPFEINTLPRFDMARPKRKTEATTLKMTPEVRDLWERCAASECRSLTNMFEVMVRDYAKRAKLPPSTSTPSKTE